MRKPFLRLRFIVSCASLVSLFSLASLAGCGGRKPVVAVAPTADARPPVPPCPDAILPGGDPLEAGGFEGKPVVRVCVIGGTEESRRNAQRAIELRPSDIFSADRVRADLEAIMKLGTFDDAAAYGLVVQQGTSVVLLYAVRDRPKVADIAFEGAKVLGDSSLNAKLPIVKDSPYDPAKVNVIAQAVREEYRGRGYDSCRVVLVAEADAASPGSVHVRIKVDEGPLWHFTKVDFRGNKKVTVADLRKASGLKVGQPYVLEEVERAALLVSALYYDRGFVQIRLVHEAGAMSGPGGLPMTFVIEEGDVHTIGKLHATKLGAPVEKELFGKVMKARPKQVFSRSALVEDIQRVKKFFEARGQKVEVNPLTEIDPKKNTVDLTLEIESR